MEGQDGKRLLNFWEPRMEIQYLEPKGALPRAEHQPDRTVSRLTRTNNDNRRVSILSSSSTIQLFISFYRVVIYNFTSSSFLFFMQTGTGAAEGDTAIHMRFRAKQMGGPHLTLPTSKSKPDLLLTLPPQHSPARYVAMKDS